MTDESLIEKAAKAIWIERNAGGDLGWGEMAWTEITSPDDWNQEALDALEEARAAWAVFEEAHAEAQGKQNGGADLVSAPTDDERKAIAQVILPAFDQLATSVYHDGPYSEAESALEAADLLIAAGFRRSVSPEPITEEQINAERERQIEKGYTPDHDREHGIAHVLRWVLHYGSRGEHLKAYAMVEAALEIAPPDPVSPEPSRPLNAEREIAAARFVMDELPDLRDMTTGEAAHHAFVSGAEWERDNTFPEPQGEPSDDGHLITDCEHGVNSLYDQCAPCEAIEQGEPTPVTLHARGAGKAQALIESLMAQANERGIRVEVVYPQADPSDAQVVAGLNAWYAKDREQNGISVGSDAVDLADYSPQSQDRMRAVLRTASAVNEQGENR